MLKKLILVALIATSAASFSATGANAAEIKVAVINIQKILSEASAAKDLQAQLEKKRVEYQGQIKAKEEKLKKEEAELVKQKNVLTKEAFEQKQKDFVNEINDVRKDVQDKRVKLDSAYKQALGTINNSMQDIINDLAAEKGFNLAFPASGLIYAPKEFDITDEVLKKLNEKLPKVSLKF